MPKTATADRVDRDALLEFLRPRHQAVLVTRRRTGGLQISPVTFGVDGEGRVVVSTYPQRAKVTTVRRDPAVSLCVLSADWNGKGPSCPPPLAGSLRAPAGGPSCTARSAMRPRTGRHDAPGQVAAPDRRDPVGAGRQRWVPTRGD